MKITAYLNWILILTSFLTILILTLLVLAKPIFRFATKKITNHALNLLLTETYTKNIIEILPSFKRFSILNFLELSLRAEEGKIINRPLGSVKHFPGYDNLMFNPRQLTKLSLPFDTPIDMSVTIGPNVQKPMTIKIPLMIGGMAYGLSLSEEAKTALAKASKRLHTATCSGEGPFLPAEAAEAGKFVLQICQWSWGARTNEQIQSAAMLEVKMGQGADLGTTTIEAADFAGKAQVLSGLRPNENAVSLPAPPGVEKKEDWPAFMQNLRQRANGIPIALKLMATDRIEKELAFAVELGFDAIVIGGAEGGSHGTPPIKQDDFGIPGLIALTRAKHYLGDRPISLIAAGGYFTPGQCLKALALGADAIYLGTVPLFALTHNQIEKILPWEPPTTLVYYNSSTKTQLNIEQSAVSVTNTFTSMILEMQEAMRALGKASLKELSSNDLVALDSFSAKAAGVKRTSFLR
ncbi:FMN-binding glutamate synthase family protein [Anaerosinus massiliensis]|uniref:FMN-binding glutamate synthase family protein n=1 Tax=Massilibacillus massiliensis TaxID=1806837 RepID=UPI000A498F01|nr:FMN-binding glutamate synthase family protein [Massilibacillus massiliensis]